MSKSLILRIAIALALLMVTASLCARFLLRSGKEESLSLAREIGGEIRALLNFTPLITVNHTVVFQESTPVMELITLKRRLHHRLEWNSTWLGSTKAIAIAGDFEVSVGFDLKERFSLSFDHTGKKVYVVHPPPRILAVEMDKSKVTHDAGWWNTISGADQTTVLNAFQAQARQTAAENQALLQEARETLRRQLRELLEPQGIEIEFMEPGGPTPVRIPTLP